MFDIIVVGGGASGMVSAICAKRQNPELHIAILEKNDRFGKKLALTGNGRCNISNKNITLENFHGANPEFAKNAFEKFNLDDTKSFFESIGVIFKEGEKGKLYPYSLQASSVVDALRFCLQKEGVEAFLNEEITSIEKKGDCFILSGEKVYKAKSVIISSGGKSGGKIASDSGYKLLSVFGHTVSPLSPAIVQIKTDNTLTKQLKGVKIDANASVLKNGKVFKSDFGEVLFCDYGLSGPPILQLSAHLRKGDEISLDLMPDYSEKELAELLYNRSVVLTDTPAGEFFTGLLQKRLGQVVLKINGYKIDDLFAPDYKEIIKIAHTIKNFIFKFIDTNGFVNAQVTHGGVLTSEFSPNTLMSKKVDGLFASGEVLDIDGDCGGFNLQWAWSSGFLAGINATLYLEETK